MAALLLVGSDASIRIDDHRTRSRRFLQRGLLLSGVIHLSLLFLFLSLTNRGDEGLVRLIGTPADILPPLETDLRQILPPSVNAAASSSVEGVVEPVDPKIDRAVFELPPDVFFGAGERRDPFSEPTSGGKTGGTGGPAPTPAREIYREAEVDEPPVAIYSPEPVYPEIAREMRLTGRVVLQLIVGEDGIVRKVKVVSGPRLLSESAQETLYRWRFRPARLQGKPVPVWVEVPVNFVIDG